MRTRGWWAAAVALLAAGFAGVAGPAAGQGRPGTLLPLPTRTAVVVRATPSVWRASAPSSPAPPASPTAQRALPEPSEYPAEIQTGEGELGEIPAPPLEVRGEKRPDNGIRLVPLVGTLVGTLLIVIGLAMFGSAFWRRPG